MHKCSTSLDDGSLARAYLSENDVRRGSKIVDIPFSRRCLACVRVLLREWSNCAAGIASRVRARVLGPETLLWSAHLIRTLIIVALLSAGTAAAIAPNAR